MAEWERDLFPWQLGPAVRRVLWSVLLVLAAALWIVAGTGTFR